MGTIALPFGPLAGLDADGMAALRQISKDQKLIQQLLDASGGESPIAARAIELEANRAIARTQLISMERMLNAFQTGSKSGINSAPSSLSQLLDAVAKVNWPAMMAKTRTEIFVNLRELASVEPKSDAAASFIVLLRASLYGALSATFPEGLSKTENTTEALANLKHKTDRLEKLLANTTMRPEIKDFEVAYESFLLMLALSDLDPQRTPLAAVGARLADSAESILELGRKAIRETEARVPVINPPILEELVIRIKLPDRETPAMIGAAGDHPGQIRELIESLILKSADSIVKQLRQYFQQNSPCELSVEDRVIRADIEKAKVSSKQLLWAINEAIEQKNIKLYRIILPTSAGQN